MCKNWAETYLTGVINRTYKEIELANFHNESLFPEYIQVNWDCEKTLHTASEKFREKS